MWYGMTTVYFTRELIKENHRVITSNIFIQHPIYAILFASLVVTLATSVVDIVAFAVETTQKYVLTSNFMNLVSAVHHAYGGCLTSVLRYVDIFHESFIPEMIPDEGPVQQNFLQTVSWPKLAMGKSCT